MRRSIRLAIAILAVLAASAASAQDVNLKAPVPTREPRVITPGLLYETRPSDETHYPGAGPSVPYDPAFIRPFTTTTETPTSTGRLGLSGWTSPNTPVGPSGAGMREVNGWLGFGFTRTWGGPPPPASRGAGGPGDAPAALTR
jgi:hypothetical protein